MFNHCMNLKLIEQIGIFFQHNYPLRVEKLDSVEMRRTDLKPKRPMESGNNFNCNLLNE